MINAPIHTARLVTEWFDEHGSEVEHLPWPAHSPDRNIFEPLWGILGDQVRKRFHPTVSNSGIGMAQNPSGRCEVLVSR